MPNNLVVYLADDHELVRQGVASLVKSIESVKDVICFKDGKELYKSILNVRPNVVFLDIEMPVWDGMRTLKEIKTNYREVKVIMLSMLEEKSIIQECIELGASGYLHKDSSAKEIEQAITVALEDGTYFSQETNKILSGQRNSSSNTPLELTEPLTERELEILKEICDGLTSKEIGDKLFVSHRTVETHKKNLMQKFNVNTTGKLISLAIKNRLVK
ncbi:MAG: response regulator transcription factor [Flavobacteriales bacterium]|nr:response regulator transcription factor [Flavobacteriales bacterium]